MKEIRGEGAKGGSVEKKRGGARNKRGEEKYEKGKGGNKEKIKGVKKLAGRQDVQCDRHSGKSGSRNGAS